MGQMVFEPYQSWELGAHTTPANDLSPKGSFQVGENTVLLRNTGQSAVIAQREGWAMQNAIPQSGSPIIIGQHDYIRSISALGSASTHLVVGSNGRLDKLLADSTLAPADGGTPIPFTPGCYPPSFAEMNNLCFIANGIDPLHTFNGTDIWNSGITKPPAPTAVHSGAGSLPVGNYTFRVTYYDSVSGLESSASPESNNVSNTGASCKITVSWVPYTGEHPYTHTRVYIQWVEKQTEHFLVVLPQGEVPLPATSLVVSMTQDQLDAASVLAPDEFENDPPPATPIGVASHVSRLFLHDGSRVYYSNLDAPEAFDPDNHFSVNQDDGQKIVALHPAHEVLIVFKRDSVWALYGEDPATWVPRLISSSVGCLNERSIMYIEGQSYWWSENGPMAWAGTGPVNSLAQGRIDDLVALEVGISTQASAPKPELNAVGIIGAIDVVNQRLLWAVPEVNHPQNNLIFPFKYKFNQWEATRWFGMDAASLASVQDTNSTPHVYLGGYKGQIFRYGGVINDGTPTGALMGKVAPTGNTLTTLMVQPGPAGELPMDGLTERYVFVNQPESGIWDIKRIGSSVGNTITLAPGVEFSSSLNETWNWSVGTIGFKVLLPWQTFGAPFIRKRLEYAYFWLGSTINAAEVEVGLFRNYNDEYAARIFSLPLQVGGLVWDEGSWDNAVWGSGVATSRHRKRLAKVCFNYQWFFRQYVPNSDVVILKVDTRAETQVDKT